MTTPAAGGAFRKPVMAVLIESRRCVDADIYVFILRDGRGGIACRERSFPLGKGMAVAHRARPMTPMMIVAPNAAAALGDKAAVREAQLRASSPRSASVPAAPCSPRPKRARTVLPSNFQARAGAGVGGRSLPDFVHILAAVATTLAGIRPVMANSRAPEGHRRYRSGSAELLCGNASELPGADLTKELCRPAGYSCSAQGVDAKRVSPRPGAWCSSRFEYRRSRLIIMHSLLQIAGGRRRRRGSAAGCRPEGDAAVDHVVGGAQARHHQSGGQTGRSGRPVPDGFAPRSGSTLVAPDHGRQRRVILPM